MAIVPQAAMAQIPTSELARCPQECTTSSPSDCLDEAGILQIAATNITNGQFFNCSNIVTVNMSNVKTIGKTAFRLCNNLAEVYMPSVIEIGEMAFEECASLANVNMSNVKTIGEEAFSKCKSLITVDMPNVETIGESVFQECASLTKVYMPNVETIGKSAFEDCSILTTVTMPRVAFGNDAFLNTNVLLPEPTCRNVTRECFSEKTCRDVTRFEHDDQQLESKTACVAPFLLTPSCLNGTDSSKNCLNSGPSSLQKMTTIPSILPGDGPPTWNATLGNQVDYLNTVLESKEFVESVCHRWPGSGQPIFSLCNIVRTYSKCSAWHIHTDIHCRLSLGQICNTTDRLDICKCDAIVTDNSSGNNSNFKGSVGRWFDESQNNHSNSTFDQSYISSIECHTGCVEGTYNSSGSCESCPPGKYSDQIAQTSCKDCPKGKYNEQSRLTAQTSCKNCPEGKYGDQTGLSGCHNCGTGKYNDQTAQTAQPSCKDCDAGKYNEQVGQESTGCKNCDVTKTTLNPGSSNASDCKTGTILRGEFINRPEKILTHNDLRVAYKRLNQCS